MNAPTQILVACALGGLVASAHRTDAAGRERLAQFGPVFGNGNNGGPQPQPQPPEPRGGGADERFQTYMVGTWAYETPVGGVPGAKRRIQISYAADLSYRGFVRTILPIGGGAPPMTQTDSLAGTWSVKAADAKRFILMGAPESDPGFSNLMQVIDEDHVRNEDGRFTATRISR